MAMSGLNQAPVDHSQAWKHVYVNENGTTTTWTTDDEELIVIEEVEAITH